MDRLTNKRVEYSHNNSGGYDWLSREDWENLRNAGWEITENSWAPDSCGLWTATKYGVTLDEAIAEWQSITRQYAAAQGCPCCGPPHNFSAYDHDGKHIGWNEHDYDYDDDDY